MDYSNQAPTAQPRDVPQLGRLKAAAERISVVQCQISNFKDRFYGPGPTASATTESGPADNYRNDLDSLFGQIELLEATVVGLDTIG